jgi:hypothetical protein
VSTSPAADDDVGVGDRSAATEATVADDG